MGRSLANASRSRAFSAASRSRPRRLPPELDGRCCCLSRSLRMSRPPGRFLGGSISRTGCCRADPDVVDTQQESHSVPHTSPHLGLQTSHHGWREAGKKISREATRHQNTRYTWRRWTTSDRSLSRAAARPGVTGQEAVDTPLPRAATHALCKHGRRAAASRYKPHGTGAERDVLASRRPFAAAPAPRAHVSTARERKLARRQLGSRLSHAPPWTSGDLRRLLVVVLLVLVVVLVRHVESVPATTAQGRHGVGGVGHTCRSAATLPTTRLFRSGSRV